MNRLSELRKILFVCGTRPEAIKLAPLYLCFKEQQDFTVAMVNTGQHHTMIRQVLDFFEITADFDLAVMKVNQTLFDVSTAVLSGMQGVLEASRPDLVVVQGDTTSALMGALAGYYLQIPVAHVEAGLRTGDRYSPFPEEMNRTLITQLADHHFAPTETAFERLTHMGIPNVHMVGNTVIDALLRALDIIHGNPALEARIARDFEGVNRNKKVILVTGHRRESFGKPFEQICLALSRLAEQKDVEIIYPVHLNPHVREPVFRILGGHRNVHLLEPIDYPSMVWLMKQCYLVLTDSGGIQEEAPSLAKPVLVMREVTERMEGVNAGVAALVGTNCDRIVEATLTLLYKSNAYEAMVARKNPYGDGHSSKRIISVLREALP